MFYGWFWIAILVLAIIAEVLTEQLVSVWMVPAAILSIILDFCDVELLWQILAFLLVTAAGIILSKFVFTKFNKHDEENSKTNIDAIIGQRCVVTEKIDNLAGCGQVKVKGQIWSARSVDEDGEFNVGDVLHIVAIEGVKLICKK